MFIVLMDNDIISLWMSFLFFSLLFSSVAVLNLTLFHKFPFMGRTSPPHGAVAQRLKPEMMNSSDLGPHGLSISLTAVGILLRTDPHTVLRHQLSVSATTLHLHHLEALQ